MGREFRIHRHEVYPRACGGTAAVLSQPGADNGLSPRVRGNLRSERKAMSIFGSIPARAGEPAGREVGQHVASVYPRACGGTHCELVLSKPALGLSPRVRGNRTDFQADTDQVRSIPARAGEPDRF